MRNQSLQLDNNTLIYLLIRESDGRLTDREEALLAEWKIDHAELAQKIKGWNNKAKLQQLLDEYKAAVKGADALWGKLQQKIRTEEI